jgi:hypothetical protein
MSTAQITSRRCPIHGDSVVFAKKFNAFICSDLGCEADLTENPGQSTDVFGLTQHQMMSSDVVVRGTHVPWEFAMESPGRTVTVTIVTAKKPIPFNARFRRQKRKSRLAVPGIKPGPAFRPEGIVEYVWQNKDSDWEEFNHTFVRPTAILPIVEQNRSST